MKLVHGVRSAGSKVSLVSQTSATTVTTDRSVSFARQFERWSPVGGEPCVFSEHRLYSSEFRLADVTVTPHFFKFRVRSPTLVSSCWSRHVDILRRSTPNIPQLERSLRLVQPANTPNPLTEHSNTKRSGNRSSHSPLRGHSTHGPSGESSVFFTYFWNFCGGSGAALYPPCRITRPLCFPVACAMPICQEHANRMPAGAAVELVVRFQFVVVG